MKIGRGTVGDWTRAMILLAGLNVVACGGTDTGSPASAGAAGDDASAGRGPSDAGSDDSGGRSASGGRDATGGSNTDGGRGGAPASVDFCATYDGRERECGLLTEGRTNCFNYYDDPEPCEIKCLQAAPCAELVQYSCDYDASLRTAVSKCMAKCIGLNPVTCADGVVLGGYARCNGMFDCGADDNSDEAGCGAPGYKCRSVDEFVAPSLRCNGTKDCSDGSDETPDCDLSAHCADGETIAAGEICNGSAVCADGSDEPAECAMFSCANQ